MTHKSKNKEKIQPRRLAAAYLHSATSDGPDNPQYPQTREQAELIRVYAEENNMEVVKTYIDAGKCGYDARSSLRSMIADVYSDTVEYDVILMRDITRWGRFHHVDEASHYEFICRRAGVDVYYVEPFKDSGIFASSILGNVKRAMEGEYRRERAAKARAARLRRKARMAEASAETEKVHE